MLVSDFLVDTIFKHSYS